jgi:hypothetical protein
MKNQIKNLMTFAILMNIFTNIQAQNKPAAQPKVAEEWTKMLGVEGSWSGPATLILGAKTYHFTDYSEFRKTADGSGLLMEEWSTDPELGKMKGTSLIGYNPNDKMIHWFSVDNMGTAHEHTGSWKTPNHFYMEHNSMQEGKKYVEKIDCMFTTKDQLELKVTGTLDGETMMQFNGNFQRKPKTSMK